MTTYKITQTDNLLNIGFGDPASNDQIVKDAREAIEDLDLKGGDLLKINGPASLPVAFVICSHVANLYGAVGVFDPKLSKYVIAVSKSFRYKVGNLID